MLLLLYIIELVILIIYIYIYILRYHFTIPLGNIFIQKDGIAMGLVLGFIFSNFYMSDLENKVFIPSINLIFI